MTAEGARPGARAVVRRGAIRHNLNIVRETAAGAKVTAVIKANAYGHGLLEVACALATADSLAVARLPEAIRLQDAGIEQPIIVLQGVLNRRELDEAAARQLELVVHCEFQVELLEAGGGGNLITWLKVDTGMRRLGIEPGEVAGMLPRLEACKGVGEVRLMTHLANADDRDDPQTRHQLERFSVLLERFDGEFSIANSAGLLGWPETICGGTRSGSWVRAGIALYGVAPFAGTVGRDFGLQAAMEFEATLIAVKHIRSGDAVGYGGCWRAPRDTVLGIVCAGYGDGYSRDLPSGTPVMVNGRVAPLAGRVSMDSAAIDLGPGATAAAGDRVVLWGGELPVETVAAHAATIPYTLLAGLTHREPPMTID